MVQSVSRTAQQLPDMLGWMRMLKKVFWWGLVAITVAGLAYGLWYFRVPLGLRVMGAFRRVRKRVAKRDNTVVTGVTGNGGRNEVTAPQAEEMVRIYPDSAGFVNVRLQSMSPSGLQEVDA